MNRTEPPSTADQIWPQWSVVIQDAVTGEVFFQDRPDMVLPTASVGKLFLLIEAARQAEAGQISLDDPVTKTDEDYVADSGLWYLMSQPTLSVHDAGVLIGSVSDNLATNVLVRLLGIEAITRTTVSLGYRNSRLLDRVRDERLPGQPPTLSVGSAGELVDLMSRLSRGEIVSPGVSKQALDWLSGGTDLSMVAGAFGLDPLAHVDADRGILLRHKTGTISRARIDVGVVTGPRRAIAYAVLCSWAADADPAREDDPRDAVLDAMAAFGDWIRGLI